jgi:hypothetical protein
MLIHFLAILTIIFLVILFISISRLIYLVSSFRHRSGLNVPEQATHLGVLYSNVEQQEIIITPEFRQQVSTESNETQETMNNHNHFYQQK